MSFVRIHGCFRRGLLIALAWLFTGAVALAEPVDGDWSAVLRPPGAALRLNLHFTARADGALSGYLISLDQEATNLTFDVVAATADTLHLEIHKAGAAYDGRWNPQQESWDGQWTQGGRSLPLSLKRGTLQLPVRAPRPQQPQPPFPYRQTEVAFDSPGAHLAGTLTLPEGRGPFPVVMLIAGSGRHTRNERILDHQPFWVIADDLTRRGVAVLRYDKRGAGGSLGDYNKATTRDFADDARAGVAYLRSRPDIDGGKIGLVGHSEGGLIAPMIAAEDPRIAFVVMLAGPAVRGDAVLLEQTRLIRAANGADAAQVALSVEGNRRMFDSIMAGASPPQTGLEQAGAEDIPDLPASVKAQIPWLRFFLGYDPAPALRRLKIPVLAMIGSKDLQVSPDQNLKPLREALAGDRRAEVIEMPGLNHLFQTADNGSPQEYGRIEETFAPEALKIMGDWIVRQTR